MESSGSSREGKRVAGPRLAIYPAVWWTMSSTVGIISGTIAGLLLPRDALIAIVLLTLVTGATAAAGYERRDTATQPGTRLKATLIAMAVAAATGVALGLTVLVGPGPLGLLLILAAASPPAVCWYCVKLGSAPAATGIHQMERSTAELCQEWHDSYEALRNAPTVAARLRIVMARQRCLDELERRDPEGLHAWLASAASAAGNPGTFLSGR